MTVLGRTFVGLLRVDSLGMISPVVLASHRVAGTKAFLTQRYFSRARAVARELDEDAELRLINARKLAELKRRAGEAAAASAPKAEKTSKEIVLEALYDRGDEVLETAYQTYPRETAIIVDQMARLMKQTARRERISGGELYSLFRSLGLRFKLDTTIKIQESGRLVDLKDKLKMKAEEG